MLSGGSDCRILLTLLYNIHVSKTVEILSTMWKWIVFTWCISPQLNPDARVHPEMRDNLPLFGIQVFFRLVWQGQPVLGYTAMSTHNAACTCERPSDLTSVLRQRLWWRSSLLCVLRPKFAIDAVTLYMSEQISREHGRIPKKTTLHVSSPKSLKPIRCSSRISLECLLYVGQL